ncbi:MAG TPA: SpoIIE family protein phosphatase [Methylibium sp.]|nr:SpoIIE family protein phosphatase [Methylibium sp.]
MTAGPISPEGIEKILAVTRALALPFDLETLLGTIAAVACDVLHAERSSVWLHDSAAGELVLDVASDLRGVRLPIGTGLVGACARDRAPINVPDCYADPRFDREVDQRSGFHTRCSVTLPLVDPRGELLGVMQVLNRAGGPFDRSDLQLAEAVAAQCALALSRTRMTEALIAGERMRRELELAQVVQRSTLPQLLPRVAGYDLHATFLPASLTGGDTYDIATLPQGLLLVLGDAAGHGIAPALSVTQMHAMLRMALRLGADLETAFVQVNDQLAQTLSDGRFVTAFIGLLDLESHRIRYLSGGQGPILHFRALTRDCVRHTSTSFPMGAMPIVTLKPPVSIELAPGDILALLTDGVYEYEDPAGEQYGVERVARFLVAHHGEAVAPLAAALLDDVQAFAGGRIQEDDITMVLVKREPAG